MIGRSWFPLSQGEILGHTVDAGLKRIYRFLSRNSLRLVSIETVHESSATADQIYPTGFKVWWEKEGPDKATPAELSDREQNQAANLTDCGWNYHEPFFTWITACKKSWQFNEGGPMENGMQFCSFCSKPIKIVEDSSGEQD